MTAWLAITAAAVASSTIGSRSKSGTRLVERIFDRCRIGKHKRALPEIIDQQRRKNEAEPRGLDRLASEMPEIGIKRLAAGHRKKDEAERDQRDLAVPEHELERVIRIDRQQHMRIVANMHGAEDRDHHKPHDHDRAEERRHPGGASALHGEQQDQNDDRDRNDIMLESRRRVFQTFDRGQNRNRRRDEGIAEKHRGADHAEHEHERGAAAERARSAARSATACRPPRYCQRAEGSGHISA